MSNVLVRRFSRLRNPSAKSKGKDKEKEKDKLFLYITKIIPKNNVLDFIEYLKVYTSTFFENFRSVDDIQRRQKLGFVQKIKKTILGWFKPKIVKLIGGLSPKQIIHITNGRYGVLSISNNVLFNIPLPDIPLNNIKDKATNLVLKSVFGNIVIENIKKYVERLPTESLILIMEGKYDLRNAFYNGLNGMFISGSKLRSLKKSRVINKNDIEIKSN